MPRLTPEDIERNRAAQEAVREYREQEAAERRRAQAAERKTQKKARSKSNPGDPWILKFDKFLDRYRP